MMVKVFIKHIYSRYFCFLLSALFSFNSLAQQTMNTASSTIGVAPFAVFFDALNENSGVVQPESINGRKEYADLLYNWNYGDPDKGNWPESNKSENKDIGYVASHVYEKPGTYTATLQVINSQGETNTYIQEIKVQDPDIVFSGENTICISVSGNFEGAPVGALQITTADITELENYIDDGKRILLKRGDEWTTQSSISLRFIEGPFLLGAYGEGINPDERDIYENAPKIIATGENGSAFLGYNNTSNVIISDIHLIGDYTLGSAFGGATNIRNILHYKLHIEGFRVIGSMSSFQTNAHDRVFIVNSHLHNSLGNILYVGSERLVLMGNLLYEASQSHVVRIWQGYKAVVNHNIIHGSSMNSATGRLALKFHGPEEALINSIGDDHIDNRSQYAVLFDNVFGTSGPWPVVIGPQNNEKDEKISDILIEGNRFLAGYGSFSNYSQKVTTGLRIKANFVSCRNNIFDGTGSGPDYQAVALDSFAFGTITGNRIWNNTVYKNDFTDESGFYRFGRIYRGVENTNVQNNLIAYGGTPPNTSTFLIDSGLNTLNEYNLLTGGDGIFTNPNNESILHRNFYITESSEPVDAGTNILNYYDFNLTSRPVGASMDIGAFEYVKDITGIHNHNENISEVDCFIYPNPSNGMFYLESFDLKNQKVYIEISNMLGQIVYVDEVNLSVKMEINLTELKKGLYIIMINTGEFEIPKRIVIT